MKNWSYEGVHRQNRKSNEEETKSSHSKRWHCNAFEPVFVDPGPDGSEIVAEVWAECADGHRNENKELGENEVNIEA